MTTSPNAQATPSQAPNVDLLASILAEFGKAPPKAKSTPAPKGPKKPSEGLVCNSLAERFNLQKTGYKVWKATGRIITFQYQVCSCCGERRLAHQDEFFKFENGIVHATWLRHEAYGVEHAEELPITHEILPEEKKITVCPDCIETPNVELILALALSNVTRQMELPL